MLPAHIGSADDTPVEASRELLTESCLDRRRRPLLKHRRARAHAVSRRAAAYDGRLHAWQARARVPMSALVAV